MISAQIGDMGREQGTGWVEYQDTDHHAGQVDMDKSVLVRVCTQTRVYNDDEYESSYSERRLYVADDDIDRGRRLAYS
jgi:hypothetical protein